MARLRISTKFRSQLSEKLMDLGNLAMAALVFGQFVSGKEISTSYIISGMILMALCYIISYTVNH